MNEKQSAFLRLLQKRRYSERTISSYLMWVEELQQFYPNQESDNLDFSEIRDFFRHLYEQRRLSHSSINQAFYALNLYFKSQGRKDLELTGLRPGWTPRPTPQVPSQAEVFKMLENVENLTHRTALALIYSTGMDLGEALNVRVNDIDLVNEKITIYLQRKRKTRHAILTRSLKPSIQSITQTKKGSQFLFSKPTGAKLSPSTLQKAFMKAKRKAGLSQDYSIRSLRHAYIKHLEFFGVPLVNIMSELGLSKNLSLDFYSKIGYPDIPVTFSPLDRKISPEEEDQVQLSEPYVSEQRISELSMINSPTFDLLRLIELLRELSQAHRTKSFMSISMIVRSIIDHVPPIFGFRTFNEVGNNYPGTKSFKNSMSHLNNSLRNIADSYLHVPIRHKEYLPTFNQVDFRADLDTLLGEIVRILA